MGMNNTKPIDAADIATMEPKVIRTRTGGTINATVVTLADGRSYSFIATRMSKRSAAANVNLEIERATCVA